MKAEDIRTGATYWDGATAVRKVTGMMSIGSGENATQAVVFLEEAGLNRRRTLSLPLHTFARFAREELTRESVDGAIAALGLAAYPLDPRTRRIVMDSRDGLAVPRENGDVVRLERLVGLGLASRDGPRMEAASYRLGSEIMEAGRKAAQAA